MYFGTHCLPQMILGLLCTVNIYNNSSLKIILFQPSLYLVPVFTTFCFSRISCSSLRVTFSHKMTIVNMVVTFIGCLGFNEYMAYARGELTPEKATSVLTGIILKVIKTMKGNQGANLVLIIYSSGHHVSSSRFFFSCLTRYSVAVVIFGIQQI